MSVIWHKVWYDLWHNKLRTLLVVLSIAMGVFAVGATFGMVDQMLPQMDQAHQFTEPSHGSLYLLEPIDLDTINSLRKTPGLADIDPVNEIEIRYKLDPNASWKKGTILSRDYSDQVYDVLQLKSGDWPDGEYLGIERMHAPFYGLAIGDRVIVEVGNNQRNFELSGTLRHPFVPPPSMYDWAWFFSGPEVMEKFGIPPGQYTQLKYRVSPPYSSERSREMAALLKDRLARQGIGVIVTVYQDPEKHWGRVFIDGFSVVTRVLAVISMLLSVVLVSNTLLAIITQQTNQVGIIKAIGGSSLSITQTYLSGVLVYCLLALLIAVPLGAITAFIATSNFLALYNIDYENFSFTRQSLLYMVLAGLAVPLLAGLFPILRGAGITVRQAIASYGLGGDYKSSWIDRAVERFSSRILTSYYSLALTNTFRRKGRLLLTETVLIIAGIMYLMVMSLSSSITATLDAEFGRRTHSIIYNLDNLQRIDRITRIVESQAGVEHADMWQVLPASIVLGGQKTLDIGLGTQLQGVPVQDPMYRPLIVAGRWLMPGDDRVVVMNKTTAEDEGIQVGDSITLDLGDMGSDEWTVVGLYRVFVMFGGGFSADALYAPREAVFQVSQKSGKAATLLVRTNSQAPDDIESVASQLGDLLKERHIAISRSETMPSLRRTSDVSFSIVVSMLMVLSWIVALVGGVGLMGALSISVLERTKEIGVMRAIGARSHIIMSMFMLEGLVQGLISWIVALPLAYLVTPWMSNAMGMAMFSSQLDYQFNTRAAFTWLAIVLVIAVLSSILPARNATRINVRQCLFYE